MQENNFERQVQLKMEELKLYPQDHVWDYIYANIKKEKRRRWLLVFFLTFLAGILYGGFLLFSPKTFTNTAKRIQVPNIPGTSNLQQSPVYAKPDSTKNTVATTQITSLKNNQSISRANEKQHNTPILLPGKIENKEKNASRNSSENISQGIKEKENYDSISPLTKETNAQVAVPEEKKVPGLQNISATAVSPAGDSSNTLLIDSTTKDEVKTIPTATSGKKSKNKNRWQWGISLSGGVSIVSNKFLGSSSQNQGIALLFSGVGSGFTASEIKPSVAATAGIFIEKNISPAAKIVIGLNYNLFSATNKVGADSSAYFQSRNAQNTYHNYYHFIELPVAIHIQLSKKIPLFWNAGASVSGLLGSNALQFNAATGLYYHDKSVFNKTQMGLSTGIEIQLAAKQKRQVFVGPFMHYNITKFSNTGLYLGEHFNFIGLHLRIIPGKK